MMLKKFILLISFLVFPFTVSALESSVVESANTKIQLISEVDVIQPGASFWIGLKMTLNPDWHLYWKNPGDSGLPPRIKWELPKGFEISDVKWPYPEKIDYDILVSYGYHDEIILMAEVQAPKDLVLKDFQRISANVSWLACKEVCIPGKGEVYLDFPVEDQFQINQDIQKQFDQARQKWSHPSSEELIQVYDEGGTLTFVVSEPNSDQTFSFFPLDNDAVDNLSDQNQRVFESGVTLGVQKIDSNVDVKDLQGLLVAEKGFSNGYRSIIIDESVLKSVPSLDMINTPIDASMIDSELVKTFGYSKMFLMVFFAFLGGLILNLMPCVLPVLSIKVLSLVQHADDQKKAWRGGLYFALGILVSFWALVGLLFILRQVGHQVGWGFQFQSPGFVFFMIFLLFVMALNMFGLFEIGTSLTRIQNPSHSKSLFWSSFGNGILTTIVATPCTAPFMGAALGYALSQSIFVSFVIFTSLGLGLATPYLILTRFTGLLKFVPKPGPWMVQLKIVLGFILMVSVVWLLWVFGEQKNAFALSGLLFGLWTVSLGLWLFGQTINKKASAKLMAVIGLGICLAGILFSWNFQNSIVVESGQDSTKSVESVWLDFSPELIAELRQQGKPIFLDFTAKWCLSCQVNKKVALETAQVQEAFRRKNVVLVRADWTNPSDVIEQALSDLGKSSIPVYVLYPADPAQDPYILPEILTPQIITNFLEKI